MPPRRKVVNGPATTGAPATSSASSSSSFLPVASAGAAATSLAVSQESLKDQGNRYFASGNYDRAIDFFTRAIDLIVLSSGSPAASSVDPSQLHILYSNRSATYNALRMFPEALSDAEQTIAAAPRWAKGYFRKGSALEGLLQFNEAAAAYAEGLKYDGNDPTLRKSADDLAALLKELRLTESELSKQNNPDADRFDLMVRWLKEGGGKFPRLYLQYYSEDYRGVHCLSRIPAEEIILYVPHHMIMTSQVAMDSGLGKQIVDAQLDLRSKHSYLAAYLLQERRKGKESYWEPYINSLPAVYANMPIHFSPEMLAHLKGSFTLEKIADRIESLRAEYDNICAHVPDMRQFTHAEFVWARLAVITRIFGLVIGGVKTDGLVAYADMLNHARPSPASEADSRWQFDDQLNGFTITALRDIPRGSQVYDSYGRKCNSRFFVNYGFALEDNEEDNEALVRVQVTKEHPGFAVKARLAGPTRNLLNIREYQIPATYRETSDREKKTRELFGYLRFLHATDAELLSIGAHEGMKLEEVEPITPRLEIEVLQHLKRACEEALAKFDTTLEEDDALLRSNQLTDSNVRNCVIMRRGEKQVLRFWTNLADTAIPLLRLNWIELRKHASKFLTSSSRDHFVTHVVAQLVKKTSGM